MRQAKRRLKAAGIIANTTDEMILNGSAVEAWRAALSLIGWGNPKMTMIQFKAAKEFIKEWIRPRLTAFEKRYPDFPIVKFIDDVFELERVFDGDDALRDHRLGLPTKMRGGDILIWGDFSRRRYRL